MHTTRDLTRSGSQAWAHAGLRLKLVLRSCLPLPQVMCWRSRPQSEDGAFPTCDPLPEARESSILLRFMCYILCAVLLLWNAPAPAAVDDASIVSLRSGRTYRVYGDLLVPLEAGPGIEGALAGGHWPQAILFYTFDGSVPAAKRADFRTWMVQWSSGSGVQFVESATAPNRILVQMAAQIGCGSSALGMVGGVQDLVISTVTACWGSRVVLHELGHALGAIHEHQRMDRDTFVSIVDHGVVANCGQAVWDANYGKLPTDTSTAYDYASIMHYPSPASYTCDGVNAHVELLALQSQPAGAPPGSQGACTSAEACQAIIGSAVISARDRHGMALRYGYRLMVDPAGNGSGTITVDGVSESCGTRCYLVAPGTLFKVAALPDSSSIASFSGACIGFSCQFQPSDNGFIQVRFTKRSSIAAVVAIAPHFDDDRIFSNGFDVVM